jgi:hypothetical protein
MIIDPKPGTITGVWSIESEIFNRFVFPLDSALKTSREYLKERKTDAELLTQHKPLDTTIQIGDEILPAPNYQEEMAGIDHRLMQLDFVQHVYDIVKETFSSS